LRSGLSSSRFPSATSSSASGFEAKMIDYALAGIVSAVILFYLTYALLRPEKF
jgi:K+-transporting ATPase KdpF subunit